ncbi:MAG: ZIP family metal transporter [Pseudomonadota bacterium]
MPEFLIVIALSLIAGMAMPAGALLAQQDQRHPDWLNHAWRHGIMAFGGGALLSAVALVLVPEGAAQLSTGLVALSFAAGGISFFLLDMYLSRHQSPAGQMAAMLSDFIPEAMALGAAFAVGEDTGILMAVLIVLQNVPEGFNAFEELAEHAHIPASKIILAFTAMALLGPIAATAGYVWLPERLEILAVVMLFASGGILYLVFNDIAPQAKLEHTWVPALGAVAGFLLGLVGQQLSSSAG